MKADLFIFAIGVAVAFVVLPEATAYTQPWVMRHVLAGYGSEHLEAVLLGWKILLAVLLFAAVQALLRLVFSAAGLALAMRLVARARRW